MIALMFTAPASAADYSFPWFFNKTETTAPVESKKHDYPNTVTLYGAVNDASAKQVINEIHEKQDGTKNPLYLAINSMGGEVYAGLRIIDAIKLSKRPIYTVDVGVADSMAAWIFEFGKVRIMNPYSTLMYHYISGKHEGTLLAVASQIAYWLQVQEALNVQIAARTGLTVG